MLPNTMSILRLCLCALLAAFAVGQKREAVELRYVIPERFERATKADDKGLLQWAEHKQDKCVTCAGKGKTKCATCERFPDDAKQCVECKRNKDRETVCRPCGGLGYWPDPLEKAHCPQCLGSAVVVCLLCAGGGAIKTDGGGDRWQKCSGCRGEGGMKCGTCNGGRLVEVAVLKPSLKDANAASLTKALATTDQMLTALQAFAPSGNNTRKEVKELQKIYSSGQDVFPPMKRINKALDDVMNKVYAGNQYQGFQEREANTLNMFKSSSEYYLKHQKRMMELAHKRAEANEKLLEEGKGK